MKQHIKTILAATLLAFSAQIYAADTTQTNAAANVSPQERAKIEEVVHQYLLQKPEVLVEAMQILQRRQYEQAEKTVKETQKVAGSFAPALFRQANDPTAGNPDGKITIVEFFDYQCPHCVDMAPVISKLLDANKDRIRVVFKEFPIRGPMSEVAARAALAANKQGKYIEFNHALFAATQPLTQDSIFVIAKQTGLDVDKLKKDMSSPEITNQLKANMKLAQDLKLFGTPAFFIGKTTGSGPAAITYVPGAMTQDQLQKAIDKS